jgi:hypothetical protein
MIFNKKGKLEWITLRFCVEKNSVRFWSKKLYRWQNFSLLLCVNMHTFPFGRRKIINTKPAYL